MARTVGLPFGGNADGQLTSRRQRHLLFFSEKVIQKWEGAQLNNNKGQDFSLETRLKQVKEAYLSQMF